MDKREIFLLKMQAVFATLEDAEDALYEYGHSEAKPHEDPATAKRMNNTPLIPEPIYEARQKFDNAVNALAEVYAFCGGKTE